MSIEKRLKEEFKQHSEKLHSPPSLDSQINMLYQSHILKKSGGEKMRKKVFLKRGIIIALMFAVLTGFTYGGTLLFQSEKGNISLSYTEDVNLTMDKNMIEKIRNSLEEVNKQLKTEEKAVIYFSELDTKNGGLQNVPLLATSKPKVLNKEEWKQELINQKININLPETLGDTYQLIGGKYAPAFGEQIGAEDLSILEELRAESKKTEKAIIWRKVPYTNQPVIQYYTTIYEDSKQNKLFYTILLSDKKISLKGRISKSSANQNMSINGNEGYYVKQDDFIYSASHVYQSIMWLTNKGDKTFINSISTDSELLSKEQLKSIALNIE